MSLARTLMGGNSAVTESVDVKGYDFSEKATMESSWVDAACEALFTDIYNVDKAFAVADVMGEVKVITEGADPTVLLESIVNTGIEKIKAAFKKFWAKLKEWFAKVKDYFKKLFMHGKKFATEFEKKLKEKARGNGTKGFVYRAYKYDFDKGNGAADGLFNSVEQNINELMSMTTTVVNEEPKYKKNKKGQKVLNHDGPTTSTVEVGYKDYTDELIAKSLKKLGKLVTDDKVPSASDYQDAFCKNCRSVKGSDVSELTENLNEVYRSGETEMEEFEEFETASVDDMIEFIKTFDKKVSEIEKDEKAFEKTINAIIKTLDGVKKTDETSGGEAGYKVAQKLSGYMSSMLTVGKVPSTVKSGVYKEAAAVYERVLKSFLSYKPAKEGFEEDDDEECGTNCATESLFESAYNFI